MTKEEYKSKKIAEIGSTFKYSQFVDYAKIEAFLSQTIDELWNNNKEITFEAIFPTWIGNDPAWTLLAIKQGKVLWSSKNPVTQLELSLAYFRGTGELASPVITEWEVAEGTREIYLAEAERKRDLSIKEKR